MTIDRIENVVQERTVTLTSTTVGGLSATIDDTGTRVTIQSATIDGHSTLRLGSAMLAALCELGAALCVDPALVVLEPEPEPLVE